MTCMFVTCVCATVRRVLVVSEGVERHEEGFSKRNGLKSMGSSKDVDCTGKAHRPLLVYVRGLPFMSEDSSEPGCRGIIICVAAWRKGGRKDPKWRLRTGAHTVTRESNAQPPVTPNEGVPSYTLSFYINCTLWNTF